MSKKRKGEDSNFEKSVDGLSAETIATLRWKANELGCSVGELVAEIFFGYICEMEEAMLRFFKRALEQKYKESDIKDVAMFTFGADKEDVEFLFMKAKKEESKKKKK